MILTVKRDTVKRRMEEVRLSDYLRKTAVSEKGIESASKHQIGKITYSASRR